MLKRTNVLDRNVPGSVMKSWTVGLVENEEKYRSYMTGRLQGLSRVERVRTWESAEAFWRDGGIAELDILFMDIDLRGMSGIELTLLLGERHPELPVVMLTGLSDSRTVFESLKAGAVGYLLKYELGDLNTVLEQILSGGAYMTPRIALQVIRNFQKKTTVDAARLTARERDVLRILSTGATKREVADQMGVGQETVRSHVKNIYKKLHVNNRVSMLARAMDQGLI